jgi:excisionase family DNA binding protein
MAVFSLRTAAQQAGTSKSTILRAIKSGRLSATKTAAGGYEIDPSELCRVYPPKPATVAPDHATQRNAGQDAPGNAPDAVAHETAVRMAVMETELRALKEMVDELKQSRDDWQQQAERATIALAAPARPWWQRLAG